MKDTKMSKKRRKPEKGKEDEQHIKDQQDHATELQDNDSDLPDIVTMAEGRNKAQKLRKEEKESGRRIAAEAKKKRQERAAKKQENKTRSNKVDVAHLQELKDEAHKASWQQPSTGDLLDDTIVQFLSAREKAERELKTVLPKKEEQKRPVKLRKVMGHSRVQLILLNRESNSVHQSAMEFKRDHLFGDRIKRDLSMLKGISKHSGL